jgi:hypothetical protein
MNNKIPNNVIGAVSSVLSEHYFSIRLKFAVYGIRRTW